MLTFDTSALEPFDIMHGRGTTPLSCAICMALGSWGSHDATFINHNTRGWMIGDMLEPQATLRPLSDYEHAMERGYQIRVWRIKDATMDERETMSRVWQIEIDGTKYTTISVLRCWVFRIVNSLPWKIHGQWCTRVIGHCCRRVLPIDRNPFRKDDPPLELKKNETPRTTENRLVAGRLIDVTDLVIKELP